MLIQSDRECPLYSRSSESHENVLLITQPVLNANFRHFFFHRSELLKKRRKKPENRLKGTHKKTWSHGKNNPNECIKWVQAIEHSTSTTNREWNSLTLVQCSFCCAQHSIRKHFAVDSFMPYDCVARLLAERVRTSNVENGEDRDTESGMKWVKCKVQWKIIIKNNLKIECE